MDIVSALNLYGKIAITVLAVALGYRVIRHLVLSVTKGRPKGRTMNAVDNPKFYGLIPSVLKTFLIFPAVRFGSKSNKFYTYGVILYHMDIITLSIFYAISAIIVMANVMANNPIPDVARGIAESTNYTIGNILTIVFGNGEHLQASFLFGEQLGKIFIGFTWILIFFAVIGNSFIIISRLFQNGGGSITSDVDPAAKGIRVGGIKNKSHLIVSLMIFCIIWSEIFSRLGVFENMVYYHAFLGSTILMFAPFTYLLHTVYVPVYILYGARRWQHRYLA